MTLTQLEYVVAIDQYRHFGKAAEACYITQPTLSMQLHKLEEELGVSLFDRSKSPVLPTEIGKLITHQARVILREQKKIFDIISKDQDELIGDFKLAVIPTLSTYLLPLFVQEFINEYPKVNLIIEESKTEEIVRLLDQDQIDAGLLVTPLNQPNIIEVPLFVEPFYLFVSPTHPLIHKDKIKEQDLNINEIWLLQKGHCFRDQVLQVCSDTQKRENRMGEVRFESGNLETLKNMVIKYSGYTLLPELAVNQLSTKEKKWVRPFFQPIPTRQVSLVFSRSFLKSKIIEALNVKIKQAIPNDLLEPHKKIEIINPI